MKGIRNTMTAAILAAALFLTAGCGPGKESESKPPADAGESVVNIPQVISNEEKNRIKKLIHDYFSSLYSVPIEEYGLYTAMGNVPSWIRDFISEKTLELAEGNTEIGIHFPRYFEINGLTVIDYEMKEYKDMEDEMPNIDADFLGKSNDSVYYSVRVEALGKCIPAGAFESQFTQDEHGIYIRIEEPEDGERPAGPEEPEEEEIVEDRIRMLLNYEVELEKIDGIYKLVTVKEANTHSTLKDRLLLFNNDFAQALPYINFDKREGSNEYVNKEDGIVYEREMELVLDFFTGLKSLDRKRMLLMYPCWEKDQLEFSGFLDQTIEMDEEKRFSDLMEITNEYKERFDYDSMPLQIDMLSFSSDKYGKLEIIPCLSYTQNKKKYFVIFETEVMTKDGTIKGVESTCRFNYNVTLSGDAGNEGRLKISGITLNESKKLH